MNANCVETISHTALNAICKTNVLNASMNHISANQDFANFAQIISKDAFYVKMETLALNATLRATIWIIYQINVNYALSLIPIAWSVLTTINVVNVKVMGFMYQEVFVSYAQMLSKAARAVMMQIRALNAYRGSTILKMANA